MIPKIIVDKRELRSPVARELDKLGCDLEFVVCEVGDYILSNRVGCERKTAQDFFNSLFGDKKLFGQLYDLKNAYEISILLFEGYEQELFTTRNVNPGAIQGVLNSIALMRIPVLYTLNATGTAEIIKSIATKEQTEDKRTFSAHGKRSHLTPSEQLVYTMSSVPDIGNNTAIHLLDHFKTIQNIANANMAQLTEVKLVGDPTAQKIREFFERDFSKKELHPKCSGIGEGKTKR